MYSSSLVGNFQTVLNDFKLEGMMLRYSQFMPRLYNYCLSVGMEAGKIIPSRAFCSDESQGFPIILMTKQFGTFPFNHGQVGGIVSTDRHGPHASHGKDVVIVQASHVGYEAETVEFGVYRRIQTADCHLSTNCGKIAGVLKRYIEEYQFACDNIFLEPVQDGQYTISINNLLLSTDRDEGLLLELKKLLAFDDAGRPQMLRSYSTARCFSASSHLREMVGDNWPVDKRKPMGHLLGPEYFKYKHILNVDEESQGHLEKNLIGPMPWIVTHPAPALAAAQITTQVEFDRTYRTILNEPSYKNKNLLFISGLNIDISPNEEQIFPLTKFIPWAAFIQKSDGTHFILEQQELFQVLKASSTQNENQIDLEEAIKVMEETKEVSVSFDILDS